MKIIVFGIAALLTCASASALTVRGSRSCGNWVQDRTLGDHAGLPSRLWLLGYLSGVVAHSGKDVLKNADNASIYLWMDNYCKANPLSDISDGGSVLFLELVKRGE